MINTTSRTRFRVNRRWFEFYNRGMKFSEFLTILTATGLEPLLDPDGNIVTVQSSVEWPEYCYQTEPKLRNLAQALRLPNGLQIEFQTGHESWKTLIKEHRVMTVISAGAALPTKEEP